MNKTVFLTGVTGSMGSECLKELFKRDKFNIIILVRKSKKNLKKMKPYMNSKNVSICWGDIRDYEIIKECVSKSDLIFNMAAVIPPINQPKYPFVAEQVNIGGVKNIVKAIKETGGSETKKFINVSSIAVYGDRLPPYNHISVGDPIYPSIGDFYGITKVKAERVVIESGLKYWAIIRQTFIAIPSVFGLLSNYMFFQPVEQCLEPTTNEDAGFGAANLIENVPEKFWRNIYNMGNGPNFRFNYEEFLVRMFGLFGMKTKKSIDKRWFVDRNFHCGYFDDYERLNNYSNHIRDTYDSYYNKVVDATPKFLQIAKIVPPVFIKVFLKMYATPNRWLKKYKKYPAMNAAFFKKGTTLKNKKKWDEVPKVDIEEKRVQMPIPFKEDKNYTFEDLKKVAEFRGGKLISKEFKGMHTPHNFETADGTKFSATPMLILHGGHWGPASDYDFWNYSEKSKKDKALAQLYYAQFDKDENYFFSREECYKERGFKNPPAPISVED